MNISNPANLNASGRKSQNSPNVNNMSPNLPSAQMFEDYLKYGISGNKKDFNLEHLQEIFGNGLIFNNNNSNSNNNNPGNSNNEYSNLNSNSGNQNVLFNNDTKDK
jgi:hypothetical protein